MGVKIKHRDPKSTDFKPSDIVLNTQEGTLFYKSNDNELFKITGDKVSTIHTTEFALDNIIKGNLNVSGSVVPTETAAFDLGSNTKQWNTLHVLDESIKFYESGGTEIGKISFVSGSGLRVRDKEGTARSIIGNIDGGSF
tara:strand:- start:12 stop:431 length:420 start_codon:yes stop_codon:yes gene_type:complete